jgi:microcystin-dependent protein
MKKMVMGFLTVSLLYSGVVLAQNLNTKGLRFVAPAVKEEPDNMVSNPEQGEIVFQEDLSTFRGYNGSTWLTMDNSSATIPAGTISMFAGSSAPTGYILCDGSAVSRTTYAALFALIGTTYGSGDGSTTFNVPDMRGVFVRGVGSQTISSVTYSGGSLGAKQSDLIQGHKHQIVDNGHTHLFAGTSGGSAGGAFNAFTTATHTNPTDNATTGITVENPSTDGTNGTPRTGAETRPANISLNYIIKW